MTKRRQPATFCNPSRLAGVRDKNAGDVLLYVDGREAQRVADTDAVIRIPEDRRLNIGRRVNVEAEKFFQGSIDHIRIYEGALQAEQLLDLYRSERPPDVHAEECSPPAEGIVAWWDGEGLDEAGANDLCGRFDATRRGTVSIAPGKVGMAYRFRPPGHFVVGRAFPNFENGFSMEAWVMSEGNDHYLQALVNRGYAHASPFDFRLAGRGRMPRFQAA